MVEFKNGRGCSLSNMVATDRLWWVEAHKKAILEGRVVPDGPLEAS
jgi:hypothetical protein